MPIEFVDLAAGREAMEREAHLHALPELFVENTRLRRHQAAGLRRRLRELAAPHWREVLRQSCKTYASSPRVALPDPRSPHPTPPFGAVAGRPRSPAGDAPLPGAGSLGAAELSRLLWFAGPRRRWEDGGEPPPVRGCPLPGDLNPLELYIVAAAVEGVGPGVYHYNAGLHCLEALGQGDTAGPAGCLEALAVDGAGGGAAVALATTAVPVRVCAPYGDRGYRMLLLEAGRTAERIDLAGVALGLHTRPVPNFFEDEVERLLEIDGVDEFVVALSLVGPGAPEADR